MSFWAGVPKLSEFFKSSTIEAVDPTHASLPWLSKSWLVLPRFQWNQILYSTAGVGGARVLASLGAAKGTDFHADAVGGDETVLRHSDPRLEGLTRTFAPPGLVHLSPIL